MSTKSLQEEAIKEFRAHFGEARQKNKSGFWIPEYALSKMESVITSLIACAVEATREEDIAAVEAMNESCVGGHDTDHRWCMKDTFVKRLQSLKSSKG